MIVMAAVSTTVKEVMEKKMTTTDENTTAFDSVKTMVNNKVWSIVVTRKGEPVGVMTERDFLRRCVVAGLDAKTTPVSKLMSSPLITVEPNARIGEALNLMLKKDIRRLYVLDQGKIIGRVTQTGLITTTMDMFRSLSDAWTTL